MYNVTQFSQNVQLRGTDQQVGNTLLARPPRFEYSHVPITAGITGAGGAPAKYVHQKGMAIRRFGIQNMSATADLICGVGYRWDNSIWKFGQWVDVGAVFTDDTVDAQDTGAGDVVLVNAVGEAAGDGFIITSPRKFGWVSINVSQASVGATTFAAEYSNAAGTGWQDYTAGQAWVAEFEIAAGVIPTGELLWAWAPPADWGPIATGQSAVFGTIPAGWFALKVDIDAATITTSALATAIEVGTLEAVRNLDADGTFGMENVNYRDYDADALVALSSTAVQAVSGYVEWEAIG